MIIYSQSKGSLTHVPEGENPRILGRGYSGHPPFVNDPSAQNLTARGPIPRGLYRIARPFDHVRLGPVVFYLDPLTDIAPRSGFFIHGDNRYGNRSGSHGCIIMARSVRDELATLVAVGKGKLRLEVIE